jgi:hypothetical protein
LLQLLQTLELKELLMLMLEKELLVLLLLLEVVAVVLLLYAVGSANGDCHGRRVRSLHALWQASS